MFNRMGVPFSLVWFPNTNIFVRNAHRDKDMIKCLLLWQFATRQFIITHVPGKAQTVSAAYKLLQFLFSKAENASEFFSGV